MQSPHTHARTHAPSPRTVRPPKKKMNGLPQCDTSQLQGETLLVRPNKRPVVAWEGWRGWVVGGVGGGGGSAASHRMPNCFRVNNLLSLHEPRFTYICLVALERQAFFNVAGNTVWMSLFSSPFVLSFLLSIINSNDPITTTIRAQLPLLFF